MMYTGDQEKESEKYVKDDTIEELEKLPHVTFVTPVYSTQVMFLKGKYEGYGELVADESGRIEGAEYRAGKRKSSENQYQPS